MKKEIKKTIFYRIFDWLLNLILIACGGIIVWLLLIITTFSSFKVPTGSMEPAILPGDYILVNKWLIGARIFDVWESAAGKEVEISRLPASAKSSETTWWCSTTLTIGVRTASAWTSSGIT